MFSEFKAFVFRGNVLDLAVAFILGVAFTAIVQSFADDVLMQLVAALIGQPDTSGISFVVNGEDIPIGLFIGAVINFLIIAAVLFLIVRTAGKLRLTPEESPAPETDEVILLREIRDVLAGRPPGDPGTGEAPGTPEQPQQP